MCDFNKISGFIIAAQVAYLISLGLMAGAILLGSNPFTSGGNIGIAIASAILAGTATGFLVAAIASLDECASGPCGSQVASLRSNLVALGVAMGVYAVMLGAFSIISWVPGLSSVTATTICIWGTTAAAAFSAVLDGMLGNAIQQFNSCMQRQNQGNNTSTAVIVGLTIAIVLAGIVVGAGGGAATGVISCLGGMLC